MKYRNGFVSNSSSSSFMIIADCTAADEAIAAMADVPVEQQVVKDYLYSRNRMTSPLINGGKPFYLFNSEVSNEDWEYRCDGAADLADELGIEPWDIDPSMVLSNFCAKLQNEHPESIVWDDYC